MSELELCSTIGFSGNVRGGLVAHPNGKHIVYPLGSILVVMEKGKPATQRFLSGHTSEITAVSVSRTGKYIASGQFSPIDQESCIILWDFKSLTKLYQWKMHRDSVQCLSFSKTDKYLASLGGDDRIVIWDISRGKGFTGQQATIGSTGNARAVCFSNTSDTTFVSGGDLNLRYWTIDERNIKITAEDAKLDQVKRIITCIQLDSKDQYVYCGTTTGDVLKVYNVSQKLMCTGPRKMLGEGIASLEVSPWGDIVVGSGSGVIAVLDSKDLSLIASTTLKGKVTSCSMVKGTNDEILCGTSESDIVSINTDDFKPKVLSKGHSAAIDDVFFPERSSDLFVTCSIGGFHVWNSRTYQELLRVDIARSECLCISVPADGKMIITGWADGKIKSYTPETGREMWTINDAHLNGVTSIATNGSMAVSGGMNGDICIWNIGPRNHNLVKTLKEHHQKITQIKFSKDGNEFVSSSFDGSVIIWDTQKLISKQRFIGQAFFNGADLHQETEILITVSSDKRIIFWDSFNGSIIRELEASINAQPKSVCISPDGTLFVTGGDDKLVKVWDFQTGELAYVGKGHCGNIRNAIFSPDQSIIVSVGEEGGIYIWKIQ
ncbi:cilia- and flagella-associated protein [Histomonas meleagridis]|uniref:cilia- and flagella-associated protein 52 n=1 Tax=Histomonas meleagridis TaxID=135588 RepID=UPI00355998EF|nr:cilia- and flagella-associated protein [Histomonas meleagridis]KAH0801785.1 cilia- and flagella-associated protein 52 [Histomonas meleagridis]